MQTNQKRGSGGGDDDVAGATARPGASRKAAEGPTICSTKSTTSSRTPRTSSAHTSRADGDLAV